MNHAEAIELAGLYVLDALDPAERAQVDAHLASCAEAHDEFADVGAVAPALATLADPVGAPAALKTKVLADYRAGAGVRVWEPASAAAPRLRGRHVEDGLLGARLDASLDLPQRARFGPPDRKVVKGIERYQYVAERCQRVTKPPASAVIVAEAPRRTRRRRRPPNG